MKKIVTVIGTRPEIIKMFPVIKELDKKFNNKLVFSGQHFSKNMTYNFFKELKIRQPDIFIKIINKNNFLNEFILKIKKELDYINPEAVIFHGDTFTTLGTAITCKIFFPKIKSIHIESGYRSNDSEPIEERIRKIVDSISNINFTIRKVDKNNLRAEGIKKNVFIVGNTINDSIELVKKNIIRNKNLEYIYATIHRSENVDNKSRLIKILKILNKISEKIKIVLSIHPRTSKMIDKFKLKLTKNIKIIKPTSYIKNLNLLYNSKFCISDSGGLQEEAIILKKNVIFQQKVHHTNTIFINMLMS